tara:strand:- start:626 stop:1033 length:408 start_codon:yes stop_codon:yes gene_type:complete
VKDVGGESVHHPVLPMFQVMYKQMVSIKITYYVKFTLADTVAPVSDIPVATFNLSPIFATASPLIRTFIPDAITVRGDVHGLGSLLHVLPAAGDILCPCNTGVNPLTLTVVCAAVLIDVGGVTQGHPPPDSTPPL